jgi:feruloyl esterase
MKRRLLKSLPLLLVNVTVWAQVNQSVESDQKACAALVHSGGPVGSAELIQPPFTVTETFGPKERWKNYTVTVPFCRVIGTLRPEPKSEIHFELWLPPRASWNGKFEGVGAGGSLGTILYGSLMRGLMRNYAVVATDNGHKSEAFDVSWAAGHPERVVDFGYRAEHVVTQAAKDLAKDFYGRAPQYSYFVGCSQGGHHGMTEAQRFPEDYDGIIAGAPVYSWTDEMVDQAWNARALQQIPSHALSKEKLVLLAKAVTKACAGPDGLIADPRKCSFDPSTLLCKGGDDNQCLTGPEIETVRQMYDGPKTSTGVQLSPGLARGSESTWDRLWSNPDHLGGSWLGVFRYMVFEDPTWDLPKMNFDRDPEVARKKLAATLNPESPDLSRFAKRDGKIIVYHGWADDMVPSQGSVNYFESVVQTLGATQVNDFYRLFMVPAMAHCAGGPGANVLFQSEIAPKVPLDPDRDMLTALEHWVEKGEAPGRFVASRVEQDGIITRTRLVCPYPFFAAYSGTGDPAQAQTWTCLK